MERFCRSFGVSEQYMDKDLSRFIASGRLACTIDKVNGVITTNKLASQNKTAMYEQVLKQGDVLLSGKHSVLCYRVHMLTIIQTFRSCTEWLDRRCSSSIYMHVFVDTYSHSVRCCSYRRFDWRK